jgi:streptogramin lyase
MRTSVLVRVTTAVMTAGLLAGCTGSVAQPASKYFTDTKTMSLHSGEFPSYLAFGAHDTLWATENGGNVIGRFAAVGELTQYPIQVGTNNDPQDIINGPGGSIWFTGLAEIGRIAPDGILKVWHTAAIGAEVGLPDALAVGRAERSGTPTTAAISAASPAPGRPFAMPRIPARGTS